MHMYAYVHASVYVCVYMIVQVCVHVCMGMYVCACEKEMTLFNKLSVYSLQKLS